MNTSRITTIGRPIDLNYPTNRAVAILSSLVLIGAIAVQRVSSLPWIQSALWGAQAALSVFLAWALCRELDPDHPMSAFVAFALALGGLCLWGLPNLTVLFWLILVVRVVNRTTGLPAGVLDAAGVVGLGLWLSHQEGWRCGLITALALVLDARLPTRIPHQLAFALLAALGTAAAAIFGGHPAGGGGASPWAAFIALGASALFLPLILETRTVVSVGDRTGRPLQPIRVQAAQILALVSGVATALSGGTAALVSLAPLWAATLGASLHWLYRTLTR